jgi:hypothetical protein
MYIEISYIPLPNLTFILDTSVTSEYEPPSLTCNISNKGWFSLDYVTLVVKKC